MRGVSSAGALRFAPVFAIATFGDEQVPGFAVAAVLVAAEARVEADLAAGGGDGDDVPGIVGHDVGGDEVHLLAGIGLALAASDADKGLGAGVAEAGGLDLDAEDGAAGLDQEVVRGGVTPRLGNAQAELGGAYQEAQFDELSLELVGLFFHFGDSVC